MTATSCVGSTPITAAWYTGPLPASCAVSDVVFATTWLLVSTIPSEVSTMPVPAMVPSGTTPLMFTMPASMSAPPADVLVGAGAAGDGVRTAAHEQPRDGDDRNRHRGGEQPHRVSLAAIRRRGGGGGGGAGTAVAAVAVSDVGVARSGGGDRRPGRARRSLSHSERPRSSPSPAMPPESTTYSFCSLVSRT